MKKHAEGSYQWNREKMIPAGEAHGLLDSIIEVAQNTRYLSEGEITVHNNNKIIIKDIENEVLKETNCAKETGAVIKRIQREK